MFQGKFVMYAKHLLIKYQFQEGGKGADSYLFLQVYHCKQKEEGWGKADVLMGSLWGEFISLQF